MRVVSISRGSCAHYYLCVPFHKLESLFEAMIIIVLSYHYYQKAVPVVNDEGRRRINHKRNAFQGPNRSLDLRARNHGPACIPGFSKESSPTTSKCAALMADSSISTIAEQDERWHPRRVQGLFAGARNWSTFSTFSSRTAVSWDNDD
jgi:hypothetical protein